MKLPLLLLCCGLGSYALQLNEALPPGGAPEASEVQALVDLVQRGDRPGTKELLAQLVRQGGQVHLEQVLRGFQQLGYDYNLLLQWLAETQGSKAPGQPTKAPASPATPATPAQLLVEGGHQAPGQAQPSRAPQQLVEHPPGESFQLLLKGLDSSNKTLVKDAFAHMLQEGVSPSCPTSSRSFNTWDMTSKTSRNGMPRQRKRQPKLHQPQFPKRR
eukprot:Skav206404  [mRNA]  locus=scaffold2210:107744:108391:+ [translate_table: standard]